MSAAIGNSICAPETASGSMADVASYSYDALGRRFQKTAGGAARTYLQDGLTPVYESTASATKAHRSIPGAIGNVVTTADYASGYSFYAYDRLGNVLAAFGADGQIAQSPVMDAFGNVLSGDRADFGLTTKQFDEDAELYYFCERYYLETISIFTSSAPYMRSVEEPYQYCFSNPLAYVDTTGEYSMEGCEKNGLDKKLPTVEALLARINALPIPESNKECLRDAANENTVKCKGTECPDCNGENTYGASAVGKKWYNFFMRTGTTILCRDNMYSCPEGANLEIMLHEFAHNCGMKDEKDWKDGVAPYPWGKSGIAGTNNGGKYDCKQYGKKK